MPFTLIEASVESSSASYKLTTHMVLMKCNEGGDLFSDLVTNLISNANSPFVGLLQSIDNSRYTRWMTRLLPPSLVLCV